MGRKRNFGALLVAMLGLIWGVSAVPSAAASEEATSPAVAPAQSEAAAELAEEADIASEEALEARDVTATAKVPWHVLRKLRKIARDIGHVKGRKHKLKTKIAKLEELPPTSKRRAAIPRLEEELRRERRRLRHLREKRWKLKKEWGLH
jgi:hypothetical protein